MSTTAGIGLARRLNIEWLDTVAAHVAAGEDIGTIRTRLFELLNGQLTGGTKPGSASHATVGVLTRTWMNVPAEIAGFRNRALRILPDLSANERLAVHWSMLLAGYPFFGDLAANVGRLLSLQGSFATPQVTRRLQEVWGERGTVVRATQCVVQSMAQWRALTKITGASNYAPMAAKTLVHGPQAELLLEGLLMLEDAAIPVDQAVQHLALFPFEVSLRVHDLRSSSRFEVHRQGLDVDVVRLVESQSGSDLDESRSRGSQGQKNSRLPFS